MNYFRLVLFTLASYLAFLFVSKDISSVYSNEQIIIISGLLNVWASYSMLFICSYLVIHTLKKEFQLSWKLGDPSRVVFLITIIISPLLAIGTYSQAKSNVANYVECKSERKISSRYSSRTYALNEELCQQLKDKD